MDDCDELSSRLWLLRQQMEQLVCALDIQQLMLANNRMRWLPVVIENVEQIVEDIRTSEAERITVSRRVAQRFDLPLDASLNEMIEGVGEPYAPIWRQHRIHLLSLQAEAEELGQANQELSRRGSASTQDLLEHLNGDVLRTYAPTGEARPLTSSASRFDRTV